MVKFIIRAEILLGSAAAVNLVVAPETGPGSVGLTAASSLARVDQVVHVVLNVVEGVALVFEGPATVVVNTDPLAGPHVQHGGQTAANAGVSPSDLLHYLTFNNHLASHILGAERFLLFVS